MLKKMGIFIVVIMILVVGVLVYLKINPPLDIRGLGSNAEQSGNITSYKGNPFVIVAQPENNGFVNIRLKEVLVNSYKEPLKAELGVGRSNHMIMVKQALGNIGEDEKISFNEISEYPISPLTKVQNEQVDSDTIKHYGIAVFHDKKINNLIIKYSYFGIPFENEIELNED
ncbi:hypothetical protein [Pontibacillus marinus]|uniref:Uncharacterized protein n=1 Tax=Pontibacillus marinus BH030004 = DSM 16465 TaxID=1385511 RepID=A0A0A5G3H7_9BACI|nr:hypothetical protein [Pontibacillus marinus]KGX87671.1 hypothetical protein N783_09645 [Pontibacillus marinus BH030004 = DSM 16465]